MATAQEKKDIADLQSDVGSLKTDVAVMKTDLVYIKRAAAKLEDFVDKNRSGITTASVLNNRIITVVLGAVVAAALFFLGKGAI